jgi:hypothetical protein
MQYSRRYSRMNAVQHEVQQEECKSMQAILATKTCIQVYSNNV